MSIKVSSKKLVYILKYFIIYVQYYISFRLTTIVKHNIFGGQTSLFCRFLLFKEKEKCLFILRRVNEGTISIFIYVYVRDIMIYKSLKQNWRLNSIEKNNKVYHIIFIYIYIKLHISVITINKLYPCSICK